MMNTHFINLLFNIDNLGKGMLSEKKSLYFSRYFSWDKILLICNLKWLCGILNVVSKLTILNL